MPSNEQDRILENVTSGEYKYGFVTDIETEVAPKGLNEDIIRFISARKEEPEWMLEFRLNAFRQWQQMKEPQWAHLRYPEIDFQDIIYYAAPKTKNTLSSLDEVDPDLLETFNKLGISLDEQKRLTGVAVDAVMDSVSVKTTFQDTLAKQGIIFCSFSEAVRNHPDLVRQYLASVVPV
ncbi:MAG TPA: Fe-S cluster assembly protein SufB, partial [Bacteroidales bacterium]|nr:Fe-S cluster assembly protein SufB [Bacteroidales bacterium]